MDKEQQRASHQLAAAAASRRHRPPSSSLLQRSPPQDLQKRTAATPPRARVGSVNLRKPTPFQMQIQCTGDFSDREGGRRSPCVKPAPFQMQIQCTCDHHHAAAAASDRPLARQAASAAGAYAKKSSAAVGAHAPHAPTDKDTNVPARNRERADVRYNASRSVDCRRRATELSRQSGE